MAATALLAIYGLGFLAAMVFLALSAEHEGATPQIVATVLALLAWVHALASVMRAKRTATA